MKKILTWLTFEYNSIHNYISFWYAKRKANKLHELTGKRYHVVPKTKNSLMVVDNSYIDHYNKCVKGKSKQININDLLHLSYYSTSVQGITRK